MSEGQNTSEQSPETETNSESESQAVATEPDDGPVPSPTVDASDADPESAGPTSAPTLADLHGVDGEAADRLREADVGATAITEGSVSYQELVTAGVDEDRATRIRRAYGLPWSLRTGEGDLEARSAALGGLGDEERAWIAESAGDWEDRLAEAERRIRTRDPDRGSDGPERPVLTPVTTIPGVDEEYADLLAEAGIVSVRTLAVADPMKVATALDIEPNRVTSWHWRAREETGSSNLLSE